MSNAINRVQNKRRFSNWVSFAWIRTWPAGSLLQSRLTAPIIKAKRTKYVTLLEGNRTERIANLLHPQQSPQPFTPDRQKSHLNRMFALAANAAPPPRAPSERLRQAGRTKSISHGPGDRGDFWPSAAQWTPCKHTPQEVTEPVSTWPWSWSAPRQTAAFISCSGLKQYVAAGSSTQVSANIQSRRSIFFRSHFACNTGIKQRQISFEMAVWLLMEKFNALSSK